MMTREFSAPSARRWRGGRRREKRETWSDAAQAPDGRVSRFAVDVRTDSAPGEIRSCEKSVLFEQLKIETGSAPTPETDYSLDAIRFGVTKGSQIGRAEVRRLGAFLRLERGGTGLVAVPTQRREENVPRGRGSARSFQSGWGVTTSKSPPARRSRAADEERQTDKSSLLEG